MSKILRTLFLLGLFALNASAQNPTNYMRTDLISASPNATSLGKYGEVPLNLSTGVPSLSIPLFTVTGSQLSLPVTLNYSFDGYRPTQPVGWVGLGWSLNAGGVITRTIKGRVDNTAGANHNFQDQAVADKINTVTKDVVFLNDVYHANYDAEPDIYSFNFGKYSGKFIKYRNKFYCFPYQKIAISGTDAGYTIVTEDGTKYLFNAIETTSPKGSSGSPYNLPSYNSSWYLKKITNAAGTENIFLDYVSEGTIAQLGTNSQTFKKFTGANYYGGGITGTDQLLLPTITNPTFVSPLRLSSIVSEKYMVNFSGGAERTDINQNSGTGHARTLDAISVTSSSGSLLKNFRLKYSYSGGTLRLDTLIDNGYKMLDDDILQLDTSNIQKHIFSYNNIDVTDKLTAAVDHYGYYRGGNFFGMMLPDYLVPNGVNRSPNINATQGALTSVQYPTGGYTTLEYEVNMKNNGIDYVRNNFSISDAITRPTNNPLVRIDGDYKYFTVSPDQTANLLITRTPKSPYADDNTRNAYKDFDIIKIVDGDILQMYSSGSIALESENSGKNFPITLTAGDYALQLHIDDKEKGMAGTLNYQQQTNVPIEGALAGGIRVKKTIRYPLTGNPIVKEYSYTDINGFSTGMSNAGTYEQIAFTERQGMPNNPLAWYDNYFTSTSSFIGENYYMGVPHYYTSVMESVASGTDKLSTRTDFASFNDYFMGVEPIRVTQYKVEGGIQKPMQKYEYGYMIVQDTFFRGLRPRQTLFATAGPSPTYDYESDIYQYLSAWKYLYATRSSYYQGNDSVSTVTYNYFDVPKSRNMVAIQSTDSKGRQTIMRMKYPESYPASLSAAFINAHVLDPVWEKQIWTKNGTDSMLVSSVVNQYSGTLFKPVKISTLSTPNITSLNSESQDGNGLYTSLLSDSRFEERANYTYDSYGNMLTQQLKNGPYVSYKWGYPTMSYYLNTSTNKIQVIAECKNATDAEFYHENFEENFSAATGSAHTGSRYMSSFTVNWTRPNARTYVISYWYRTGGAWKYKTDNYLASSYTCSGGDAYDDISVYPADAQISTYTYLPGTGLSGSISAKGETTFFEYDASQRLINIRDNDGNIVKHTDYHIIKQ
ncbi:hypothetical protein [Mucilaginibacter sp.]|jgi:YD repeat-containing protein|uniref:hypothetical protein n=1 Tax=Mucilaginibacter sp. TaxID=1882438 RepID=UPI00356802B5